jgi:hypothetical protein
MALMCSQPTAQGLPHSSTYPNVEKGKRLIQVTPEVSNWKFHLEITFPLTVMRSISSGDLTDSKITLVNNAELYT